MDDYLSLSLPFRIAVAIALFLLCLCLIKLMFRVVGVVKGSVNTKLLEKVKRNKGVRDVLGIVEAIDNCFYSALQDAKQHDPPKQTDELRKVVNFKNFVWVGVLLRISPQRSMEWVARLMNENGIGLPKDAAFEKNNKQLRDKMKLKSIPFRNDVYAAIDMSYGFYSFCLYIHWLKSLTSFPLLTRLKIREMEDRREQGVGNRITSLAIKLGSRGS